MNGDIRFVVDFSELTGKLDELLRLARKSERKETKMANDLTNLTAKVEQDLTVDQSAITLIEGLAQAIRDAGNDQAKLDALADQLDASSTALAAAVAANTAPVPPPVEPPPAA